MKVIKNGQRTQTDISQQKPFEIPNNIWKKILNAVNHQGNASQKSQCDIVRMPIAKKARKAKGMDKAAGKGNLCTVGGA